MATTVLQAFSTFINEEVNLDSEQTGKARISRDWLIDQINHLNRQEGFLRISPKSNLFYGSFARSTKIRPLDDIDIMIALDTKDLSYRVCTTNVKMIDNATSNNLSKLCYNGTRYLNSRMVINAFIRMLSTIAKYDKAPKYRNGEACILDLKSYPWSFDIVPCFRAQDDSGGDAFYLIPDGNGFWRKTDPRIDRERVQRLNKYHDGKLLNIIRLVKYWNRRPTMPSVQSYLIECIVLDFYADKLMIMDNISNEFSRVLEYISKAVLKQVSDPKGFEVNINNEISSVKIAVARRAKLDQLRAEKALSYQEEGNHKIAINLWRLIFGSRFPTYGK
jgi:hypothetical protein